MTRSAPDLLGREADLAATWETLAVRSLLLTGPRRVGKTELLRALVSHPRTGWVAVRVDLEGETTVAGAVRLIRDALASAGLVGVRARAGAAAARVESVGVLGVEASVRAPDGADPWLALRDLLSDAISQLPAGDRLVIALDEAPWWLDGLVRVGGAEAGRNALAQLRRLRQGDALRDHARFVFTGSVGLAGLAHDLGASAEINDITPAQELRPLSREAGSALFEVTAVSRGLTINDGACRRGWEVSGGLPHWIKELAQRVRPTSAAGPIGEVEVDRAVEELLQPRMRNIFEDEGGEHLRRRYGAAERAAMFTILDAAASGPSTPQEALLSAAMAVPGARDRRWASELLFRLSDAYYLDKEEGGDWHFTVPLFRLWWQRYGSPG